jgi:hypothetical protein
MRKTSNVWLYCDSWLSERTQEARHRWRGFYPAALILPAGAGSPLAPVQGVPIRCRETERADDGRVGDHGVSVTLRSLLGGLPHVPRVLTVLIAIFGGGCSFILDRRPPPYYLVTSTFECTKSVAPAVVDTTLATLYAGLTVGNELAGASGHRAWFLGSHGLSILLGLHTLVYASSAAWGFDVASECREALRHSVELGPAWPTP